MTEQHDQHDETEDHWNMITTAEAAYRLRYGSTASFRRAWRRAKMPMYPQLGSGRWLVKVEDVERFLGTPVVGR